MVATVMASHLIVANKASGQLCIGLSLLPAVLVAFYGYRIFPMRVSRP
jgi:hypothetical protein